MMKKGIAFVVGCVFLFINTELDQLIKLPILIQHYQYHQSEQKLMTLADFLSLHYSSTHPLDNDESEDENLPFKSVSNIAHTDVSTLPINRMYEHVVHFFIPKKGNWYNITIPNKLATGIFHPPQFESIDV